jgi:serine/threonine protein phosphatase PrpC
VTAGTCPSCGEPVGGGDSFCESCGTELAPPVASTEPPGYLAECPACAVDPAAAPSVISAEGYCESCGRKVPSGRDHSELDLGLVAGVTDRGLRHSRNEDAMALAAADTPDGAVAIAVVCDGVSTSPRSDEASLAATQAAARALLTSARRGDDPEEASLGAVRSAQKALTGLGAPGDAPSATYVSVVIGGDAVTVCWLGDSRAYWLAAGPDATRLSTDDSMAEELVARGTMGEAEALASPQAHVITRWLGADLVEPEPHVLRFEPPGPGVVMVCSDGLWNYQPDAAGLAELALPAAVTDPLGAAAELVKFAIDAGGIDNITVVLAPFPLAAFPPDPSHPKTVPVRRVATLPRRTPPMTASGFTIDVDQNQYLPEGGVEVSAIVTITSASDAAGLPQATDSGSAEIIIIDCSGSMEYPHTKIAEARAATAAAVDVIRDGVTFAVIAGTNTAWPVFPVDGSMATADASSRAAAKQAVAGLRASGGTAIGQWLELARQTFSRYPATLRHAILLTDGKNQHESPEQLAAAVRQCESVFSCDCRGVGTDWEVKELRTISTALLGSVDIVPDPSGLAADFAAMMQSAMGKQVADVALQVWTPQHATVKFVKQVAPTVDDLTGRRTDSGPQAGNYPTGAWGPGESRDYHVGVEVTPAGLGQEMLAARVRLVADSPSGPEVLGQGLVRAIWTDDEALSTKINPRVAHYTGQAELAAVIQDGLEARKQGDEETATAKLGRAVALAHQSGNEDTAKLLAKVVDVVDAETGKVRLRQQVTDADEMALDTRSTKTVRARK